jgi:hypothetical protein
MDRQYIENERIVERYLSGDLTVREARDFQRFCSTYPELLDEWTMPPALKAQLIRRDLEPERLQTEAAMAADAVYAESRPGTLPSSAASGGWRHASRGVQALAVALLLAVAGLIVVAIQARSANSRLQAVTRQLQTSGLQAHSTVRTYRVKLERGRPQRPTLAVGWPTPPELLDMYIDVTEGNYNAFQVTIDRLDGSRVLQIRRISRDSNRELRLALNSSAFGPGEYLMKLDGYTWRGQTRELGWIMLGLQ